VSFVVMLDCCVNKFCFGVHFLYLFCLPVEPMDYNYLG
jgi:hypothetical protein